MNVLVDTSVWSLALRRKEPAETPPIRELHELILEGRVQIIGPIRQEVLSGVRAAAHFQRLRDALRAFPDLVLTHGDFERAAKFFNRCRRHGIQGSNTDFLLCSVADHRQIPILTTDRDFPLFAKHIPVRLHEPRL